MKKRITLASPEMIGNERKYVEEAFDSNWIAPLGPFVNRFEDDIQKYLDGRNAVALSSGTAAIHLALKIAGVKRDDIVFCQSLTFAASCNPVVYEGAIPVFIDSEKDTLNMDPEALRLAFKKYKAKAVIAVDLYGIIANYDEIEKICNENNAILISDATEALGSEINGRKAGTFGEFAALSFNGNKIITTSGGGMLLTTTEEEKKKAIFYATQAKEPEKFYQHEEIGYNYRLSNISAAIGVAQFEVLDKKLSKKRRIHERYVEGLKDVEGIKMFIEPSNQKSNYWLSTAFFDDPKSVVKVLEFLDNENIEARHIWKPMHLQPVYKNADYIKVGDKDISKEIFETGICLPSDTNMSDEDQDRVIDAIKRSLS